MSLSEQEQRALREIEQSLFAEDPKFASSVAHDAGYNDAPQMGRITMRSVALIVLGIVLLLGGVALASASMWAVIISIIGFGVMMLGGVMALRTPAATPTAGPRVTPGASRQRSARSMSMEENFRRRFEDPQA